MESIINNDSWKFESMRGKTTYRIDGDTIENKLFQYSDQQNPADNMDLDFQRAATVHKIARNNARNKLVPGAKIKDIVESTEDLILSLFKRERATYFNDLSTDGLGFPVGISINNVIAHDSALLKDNRVLEQGDIVKFDFGVHKNGRIIDSAFTHIVGEKEEESIYKNLLDASRDATYSGIALSGPDARILEISEFISEIISSYELPLDAGINETEIIPVNGIGGHDILPYKIHGNKLIFSSPNEKIQGGLKMEEGEIYAIERYATTGLGNMTQPDDINMCSHFMINHDGNNKKFFKRSEAYKAIKNRQGLPFTLSWCDMSAKKFNRDFKEAIMRRDIMAYPPLYDTDHAKVAQFEHTIKIRDCGVEIYSKGDDY